MSEQIRSAREAMEGLTAERMNGAVAFPPGQAEAMASAWRELAKALEEPLGAVELANPSERARETGAQLCEKVMRSVSPLAQATAEERAEGFPERRRAAERAARGMGFDAEDREILWELGFNLVMCELPLERRQQDFRFMCRQLNQKHRFSETIAWAIAERSAWEGLQKASDPTLAAWQLAGATDRCREALEDVARVCEARHDPEGPRAWLGDREVKVARAMAEIVALGSRAQLGADSESKLIQGRCQSFAPKGEAFGRVIEASAQANHEKRQELESDSVANVKKRKIT